MAKSDWELFNCSEDYEVEYVSNQYKESAKVKKFLNDKCASNVINNSTHAEVYKLLENAGFIKK